MKSLQQYITEKIIFEELDYSLNHINEHMFNGKTNGRTWWGDIKAGCAFIILGLGTGIAKFWNWLFKEDQKKKEENDGKWPGFEEETIELIKNDKLDLEKNFRVSPVDTKMLERDLELIDANKSPNYKFQNFCDEKEEYLKENGDNKSVTQFFEIVYGKERFGFAGWCGKEFKSKNKQDEYKDLSTIFAFELDKDLNSNNTVKNNIVILSLQKIIEYLKKDNRTGFNGEGVTINFLGENYDRTVKKLNLKKTKDNVYIWKFKKVVDDDDNDDTKDDKKDDKKDDVKLIEYKPKQTNEALDEENIFWKIDKWFENNEDQRETFMSLISNYGKTVDVKTLSKDIENTTLKDNLKEFINFLYDDFDFDSEKDYIYQLKKIIEFLKQQKG